MPVFYFQKNFFLIHAGLLFSKIIFKNPCLSSITTFFNILACLLSPKNIFKKPRLYFHLQKIIFKKPKQVLFPQIIFRKSTSVFYFKKKKIKTLPAFYLQIHACRLSLKKNIFFNPCLSSISENYFCIIF